MNQSATATVPAASANRAVPWLSTFGLMVGIVAIGAAFRLSMLGWRSLWLDETLSVAFASRSLADIWRVPTAIGADPHPRLYYTLLHEWMQVFGRSEMAVRLPTAFASILNLPLLAALAARLFNRRTAVIAVALLAVAPLEVWYAQEARMYMMVATCGLMFAVFLTVRQRIALPGLLLSLTVGLYIDHTMLPLSIGLSVLFLIYWWQHDRDARRIVVWLAAVIGAAVLYVPNLPYLRFTFSEFNRIFVFQETREALGLPQLAPWHYLAAMLAIAILIGVVALAGQRLLRQASVRHWVGPLVVVVFGLVTLLIPIPRLFGIERVLVTGWPYVVLLVAWLIAADGELAERVLFPLLCISAAAATAALLVPKDDWRGAITYVNNRSESGDVLWMDPHWNRAAAVYYQSELPVESGTLDKLQRLTGDIWIVAERFPGLAIPSSPSEVWLEANRKLAESRTFYRLEVRRYSPRPAAAGAPIGWPATVRMSNSFHLRARLPYPC